MKGNEMDMWHVWGDKNYNTQFSLETWVKFLKIYDGQQDNKETDFKKYDGAGGWKTERHPVFPRVVQHHVMRNTLYALQLYSTVSWGTLCMPYSCTAPYHEEHFVCPKVGVKESMDESYGDRRVAEKWHGQLPSGALVTLQGWQIRNAILFHPRPSVHGEEPYPMRGDPVTQNTAYLKE
jgi:hypothetical protein